MHMMNLLVTSGMTTDVTSKVEEMTTVIEELTTTTEETTAVIGENLVETVEKANVFFKQLENLIPSIINFGIDILISVLIFAVGKFIIKYLLRFCNRFFQRTNIDVSIRKFLNSLINAVLYVVLTITICAQLGIETSSFIAVVGSAGLAVGLAFQGSLSNLAGGVLILIQKPFQIGDYIIEGGSGMEGIVQQIDICYTTLKTYDNRVTVIPNGNLSNSTITNVTKMQKRRVDVTVGISYRADLTQAKAVLEQVGKRCEYTLLDEPVSVYVEELADSAVVMALRVWCKTDDYWDTLHYLSENVKLELDRHEIEIPFQQLVVHMEQS